MLIGKTIALIICALVPVVCCRHISSSSDRLTALGSTNTARNNATKRQLKKTHLRLHGKPPRMMLLQEGDNHFLECQAGGTPAPSIHWLKDGNVIPQSENTQVQSHTSDNAGFNTRKRASVSFTTSRLYLDCLSVEDEGEYTCVAENPYQRISSSTTVTVLSSDEEIECEKKSHEQAPRITFWTKAMIITQGGQAKFSCRAEGYPRPTIRWQGTQEEELTSEDFNKFEILPEGDLIIRNVNWSDMGTYNCIAENVHGSAKVEVFLYPSVSEK